MEGCLKQNKKNPNISLQSTIVSWAYEQMTRKERQKFVRELNRKLDEELIVYLYENLKEKFINNEEKYTLSMSTTSLNITYSVGIKNINHQTPSLRIQIIDGKISYTPGGIIAGGIAYFHSYTIYVHCEIVRTKEKDEEYFCSGETQEYLKCIIPFCDKLKE